MAIPGVGRRRTILVDKSFQLRATFVGIAYIVAVALSLSLPLINMMRSTGLLLEGHSDELVRLYQNQQTYTIISLVVFFVGIVAAWTVFTLWRTHKIAGPLVKITRHINLFANGKFGETIHLRSKDELQTLADSLNMMAESLGERDQNMCEMIRTSIERTKQRVFAGGSPEASMQAIRELEADVDRCFAASQKKTTQETETKEAQAEDLVYS